MGGRLAQDGRSARRHSYRILYSFGRRLDKSDHGHRPAAPGLGLPYGPGGVKRDVTQGDRELASVFWKTGRSKRGGFGANREDFRGSASQFEVL